MAERRTRSTSSEWDWSLWLRWVLANTLGEVMGLGTAAMLGIGLNWAIEQAAGTSASLARAGVMVAAGSYEGLVVGIAQGWVVRRPLPALRLRAWVLASTLGAFVAWVLGSLPSTLMEMGADSSSAPPAEPSHALVYTLAVALGIVAGLILALPQWWVLRRHADRAGWWLLANAAAWAVGMPLIFVGVDLVPPGGLGPAAAAIGLGTGAVAGAVVGAIHGVALVRLSRQGEGTRDSGGPQGFSP